MSPKRGGQSTQSGIYYQNSVAALFLGRLCDTTHRLVEEQITGVRVETLDKVDDIVITFADSHKLFVQAKENISTSDNAWKKLWQDFEAQYLSDGFQQGADRLRLQVGTERSEIRSIQSLCENANVSTDQVYWLRSLTSSQKKLLEKVRPLLSHQFWNDEVLWHFLGHIETEVWTLSHIEKDLIPYWMPQANKSAFELFRMLRDRVGGQARVGGVFTSQALRKSLLGEVEDLIFHDAPDIDRLRKTFRNISAILPQHKNTWGETGKHLVRPIVSEIVDWLIGDVGQKNVGLLVDQAGMGKTVIMRDVLHQIESKGGLVLALKADQQLSDISSPASLIEELSLPYPIEVMVERLAKIDRVVILIDQIDALSLALAHDEKALNLALDLIARLRRIPNVAILVSCRLFDRNSDPRLRHIEIHRQFSINPLKGNEVKDILSIVEIDYNSLSKSTRELLTTPLHLSLFVQAIQSGWTAPNEIRGISSLQELYDIIWKYVIFSLGKNIPSEYDRKRILRLLTDYMDKEQKIVVPNSIFISPTTIELQSTVNWLASKGIIVESKAGWTFLHQSFFDYCFARFFVERNGNLVEEIVSSPQGLFERSKLVQVLSYLRGYDHSLYLKEYQKLLKTPHIRFHLWDLLVRWFGSIPNPSDFEWLFIQRKLIDPTLRSRFLSAMYGNGRWFDRLLQAMLPEWMSSTEDEFVDTQVIPFLISLVNSEQAQVIGMLEPYKDKGKKWENRIYSVLSRIQQWETRGAALLLEEIYHRLPKSDRFKWHMIDEAAKEFPDVGCRFLSFAFNEALDEYVASKQSIAAEHTGYRYVSLIGILDRHEQTQLDDVIKVVTEKEPQLFLHTMISWLERYYSLLTHYDDQYWFTRDELSDNWNDDPFRIRRAFVQNMISALVEAAAHDPDAFDDYSNRLLNLSFVTPQRLVARVYSTLPKIYHKHALTFLLADSRRLDLGDHSALESRKLIQAIYPFLRSEEQQALEKQILGFNPIYKHLGIKSLQWRGLEQLYLLQSVPSEMLTTKGQIRLRELTHKFPNAHPPEIESELEGGFVGSPIAQEIANIMTDKNWLAAFRKYSGGYQYREFLKGGARELSTVLQGCIKSDPPRFFSLLKRVPDDIDDSYVIAFINGFAEADGCAEMLFDTIRRFSLQQHRNIRLPIAWALEKTAQEIPSDMIDLLENTLHQPMGEDELWWSKGDNHGDPFSSYLSSNRGKSFEALMRIWSRLSTPYALDKRWSLIEATISDPSTALRAGSIHWLTFLIKYDRDRAISLFEKLIANQEILLTLRTTREFLYWAFYKNFLRLAPYLINMMESDSEDTQEQGAQLACVAAISPAAMESEDAIELAGKLAETSISGKVAWRRGAARIFSVNITGRPKDSCEDYLIRLLNEKDEKVRNHIDSVFHSLKGEHLFSLKKFLEEYSKSSTQLNHFFAEYLLDHGSLNPEWTLKVVKTIINNLDATKHWYSGIEELIRLVLKIYTDPTASNLQKKAMDVFDMLMEKYSGYATRILDEWDRN